MPSGSRTPSPNSVPQTSKSRTSFSNWIALKSLPPGSKASFGSTHLPQLGDAAGVHPFGDEDVAGGIKTGVVRMEEPTGHPFLASLAAPEFHPVLEHLLAPRWVFAEVHDDLVVLVE